MEMNEQEHELSGQFGEIAKKNGYSANVCFTIGAIAFDKKNVGHECETLQNIIEIAKQYPQEDEFMEQVVKKYSSSN